MPQVRDVHIDAALTNVSVAYRNNDYIASAVAPVVGVRRQSDRYFVYDTEREWLRSSNDRRAPGAEANEVDFSLSSDTYFCDDHALVAAIPDEERDNADPAIQPDIDRVEFLSDKIGLNREIQLETALRTTSGIDGLTLSSPDRWEDPANDPLANFAAARASVFARSHRRPNTVVMPHQVFDVFRNHPKVVERVKYSALGVINEQLAAQLLDVERVLVPRAVMNTAAKGQAAVVAPVWGRNVYLLHVPARAALKQVAAALTFAWTGAAGNVDGVVVERWREPRRKADMVRVQHYYDSKIVATGAAYRLLTVIN